mmetsp:Transcript_38946/g.69752  ORF Transcript_38946/g.69752 Transcript_38946/m.69752 type:complete len:203 (+) Transcript_38946:397-1005(+)
MLSVRIRRRLTPLCCETGCWGAAQAAAASYREVPRRLARAAPTAAAAQSVLEAPAALLRRCCASRAVACLTPSRAFPRRHLTWHRRVASTPRMESRRAAHRAAYERSLGPLSRCWTLRACRTTFTSIWWTGRRRTCWRWGLAPRCTCGARARARSPSCATWAPTTRCARWRGRSGGRTSRSAPFATRRCRFGTSPSVESCAP